MSVADCCSQSSHFEIEAGIVINQLGVDTTTSTPPSTASITPSSTGGADVCSQPPIPSGAIAGLAVEGGILALTLAALAFMGWKAKRLAKDNKSLTERNLKLDEKRQELEGISYQQWRQAGHGATELPHYGYETTEGRQELSPAVPELSGIPVSETANSINSGSHPSPPEQ